MLTSERPPLLLAGEVVTRTDEPQGMGETPGLFDPCFGLFVESLQVIVEVCGHVEQAVELLVVHAHQVIQPALAR